MKKPQDAYYLNTLLVPSFSKVDTGLLPTRPRSSVAVKQSPTYLMDIPRRYIIKSGVRMCPTWFQMFGIRPVAIGKDPSATGDPRNKDGVYVVRLCCFWVGYRCRPKCIRIQGIQWLSILHGILFRLYPVWASNFGTISVYIGAL